MRLFLFVIKKHVIMVLCNSHNVALSSKLHKLRRGSDTTHRHLIIVEFVIIQASLANGNINTLISESTKRSKKGFIISISKESTLIKEEEQLGKHLLLGEIVEESTNKHATQGVILTNTLTREHIYSITDGHDSCKKLKVWNHRILYKTRSVICVWFLGTVFTHRLKQQYFA